MSGEHRVSGTCLALHPPCTGYPHTGPIQWDNQAARDVRDSKAIVGLQHRILRLEHDIEGVRRNEAASEGRALLKQFETEKLLAEVVQLAWDQGVIVPDDAVLIWRQWDPANVHGKASFNMSRLRERVKQAEEDAAAWAALGRTAATDSIDWDKLVEEWLAESGFEVGTTA